MKIYLILLFFTFHSFSQDAFIQINDGSKFFIDHVSVRVITNEKKILFKKYDNSSEQVLNFDQFDFVSYSNFKFKILNLNKRKDKDGFFILAESKSKFLLCKILTPIPQDEEEVPRPVFQMLIVDNEFNTLFSYTVNEETNSKNIETRNFILTSVKESFPNCDDLINRFTDFDKKNGDINNLSILGVFNSPVYYVCN